MQNPHRSVVALFVSLSFALLGAFGAQRIATRIASSTDEATAPPSAEAARAVSTRLIARADATAEGDEAGTSVLAAGIDALIDRQYASAVEKLSDAVPKSGDQQDYALLLLGSAQYYDKKYDDAIVTFDRLLNGFPNSQWAKKALFRKADCYLATKRFDKAAELYEPEMLRLVSNDRREEIANTYIMQADRYFDPPKKPGVPPGEQPKPDYEKARNLYQKALEIGLTSEKEARVLLQIARSAYELKQYDQAIERAQHLIKEHPKSPVVEQARYTIGLSYLKSGDSRSARNVFRDLLEDYPSSSLREEVTYAIAESYGVPNPQSDRDLDLGVKALREFLKNFPSSKKADQAEYYIGLSYFNRSRYEDAVKELQSFLKTRKGKDSEEIAQAKNQLGLSFLRQKKYDEAIAAWRIFLSDHQHHRLWETVQRQMIDAAYLIGEDAYKAKKYAEARKAWETFQSQYPLDGRNADIMFRLGMMLHEEKNYDAAIAEWMKLVSKYPSSEPASRAQFMIGLTYETKLDKFEEALQAYEKVPGQWEAQAKQRLAAMRQRKLVLYTERTFTTADKPVMKVITRNVPRLAFRAYRVDLGDYFDKLHSLTGVQSLDLALIEPDKRWETDVLGFRKFKEHETGIDLPFTEPGAYAVTCAAMKGQDEEGSDPPALEATTVVLVSDLAIISKVTRRDLLVFAENQRTKKAWPNAICLVSDGKKIVHRGKTDEQGILHWKAESGESEETKNPLKNTADLRVLVSEGGHYASTEGSIQNLSYVAGLTPKAFIYTDRPVYRAGQVVRLRGIVRKVDHGNLIVPAGEEFSLQIMNPNGVAVHQRTVTLNDFGTLRDDVPLRADAPVGDYQIQIRQGPPAQPRFSATSTFAVRAYQLQKVQLKVETEKSVYLRGEEIKGKIIARYYYGAPLAKRSVHFGWDEAGVGQRKDTDEKGEIAFTIPTRKFEEEQPVQIWARLEEEGVDAQTVAYVAVVGLQAEMKLLRDVFLVGEKFTVDVKAKDLAGKPSAAKFTLKALKRYTDDVGRMGEREITSSTVETDAKGGKGNATLSLGESGPYVLRLTGVDANGNPFTTETHIEIVGDDDKVKLRILTDRDTFKVGETPDITVVSRANPNIALVTYEGERIYGYQLVDLTQGTNAIKVPMTLQVAPGFQMSVAIMDGNEFHTADHRFRVEHELHIKITPEKKEYRPGDRVKVTLEVTDQNGVPVSAELSLACIDEALFALSGTTAGDLSLFFSGRGGGSALSRSSCTFHYSAEARQQVLQVKEAESMMATMLAGAGGDSMFADLPAGHWAYDALRRLGDAGLISGYSNGTFNGKQTLSRYDAAQMIAQATAQIQNAPPGQQAGMPGAAMGEANVDRGQRSRPPLGKMGPPGKPGMPGGPPGPPGRQGGGRAVHADTEALALDKLGDLAQEFRRELKEQGVELSERAPFLNDLPLVGPLFRIRKATEGQESTDGYAYYKGFGEGGLGGGGLGGGGFGGGGLGRDSFGITLSIPGVGGFGLGLDPGNALRASSNPTPEHLQELAPTLGEEEAGRLARALRNLFPETAFWQSDVVTDGQGKATVEFILPDNLTSWRLSSIGITKETLAGSGSESVTSSKPLHVELKTPAVLQQGDTIYITAAVHNNSGKAAKANIAFVSDFGKGGETQRATVDLPANGIAETSFKVEVPDARECKLRANVKAGDMSDTVEESVGVRAFGIEHIATAGGTASADATVPVALPGTLEGGEPGDRISYKTKQMTITVGPTLQAAIVDAASGGGGGHYGLVSSSIYRSQSLIAGLRYLRSLNRSDQPEYRRLSSELEANLIAITGEQNEDGGWSWASKGQYSDPFVASDAVVALSHARQLGFSVRPDTLARGLAYLQNRFQSAGESAHELKATILRAQAASGKADFTPVNRLHRIRAGLSTRSLALLTLTLMDMNREPMAKEVEQTLLERIKRAEGKAHFVGNRDWVVRSGKIAFPPHPDVELTALATLAIARVEPREPALEDLSNWLWSQRRGFGWATPRGHAWSVAALAAHAQATQVVAQKYTLTVSVNGKDVKTLDFDGNARTTTVAVPDDLVQPQSQVTFRLAGKGTFTYSCLLVGFTDQIPQRSATRPAPTPSAPPPPFIIKRKYLQPQLTFEGELVPRGFNTVSIEEPYENLATQTPTGREAQVVIEWHVPDDVPAGNYVVVREPIPSGCRVLEDSISGDFERYEMGVGEIAFYFYGKDRGQISYDLFGALSGQYRTLPPKVQAFDEPQLYAYGEAQTFGVLKRDEKSTDSYRMTADELYYLGAAHFANGREILAEGGKKEDALEHFKKADAYLSELYAKETDPKGWKLHEEPARETVRMLFTVALHRDEPQKVVRFFEILHEQYPSLIVPFQDIVKVAQAYKAIGEREREMQVYRAIADAMFVREAQVAGALSAEGEFVASVAFLRKLMDSYPSVTNTESALYGLAQTIAEQADKVAGQPNGKTEAAKLKAQATGYLRDFLTLYPENPLGSEASFALAVNLVERERFAEAVRWSDRCEARYPNTAYTDDFQYIASYASFLDEKFDSALSRSKRLATEEYPLPDGRKGPSEYKRFAQYILAQIAHARGQVDDAVKNYTLVAQHFPDAFDSLDYFEAKSIRLPEVTALALGDEAKLKIESRNIADAEIEVYRVDLLKLYQQRQDLQSITRINLAGIKPEWKTRVPLNADRRYTDETRTIDLPLSGKGAYFVVAKTEADDDGPALTASAVVVKSNLSLDVQEDPDSGRVRVNVTERESGKYQAKADVWMIGSGGGEFRRGTTDLRGIVAATVNGAPTVIVYHEGDYAFYRSPRLAAATRANVALARKASVVAKAPPQASESFYAQNSVALNSKAVAARATRAGELRQILAKAEKAPDEEAEAESLEKGMSAGKKYLRAQRGASQPAAAAMAGGMGGVPIGGVAF